jgi:hypothetical protein
MFYVKNKWFKLNGKNYHTVLLIEKNDDDKKNGLLAFNFVFDFFYGIQRLLKHEASTLTGVSMLSI